MNKKRLVSSEEVDVLLQGFGEQDDQTTLKEAQFIQDALESIDIPNASVEVEKDAVYSNTIDSLEVYKVQWGNHHGNKVLWDIPDDVGEFIKQHFNRDIETLILALTNGILPLLQEHFQWKEVVRPHSVTREVAQRFRGKWSKATITIQLESKTLQIARWLEITEEDEEDIDDQFKHLMGLQSLDDDKTWEDEEVEQPKKRNIDLLYDVELEVTVEIGKTKMKIKNILELTKGSIIQLEKLAGEPVDVKVGDKIIARGEVVVIDESFGIKIVDIIDPKDRLSG